MKLFYRIVGQGQPVVILHGVFGSSDNWLTMSKLIAEKGYAVYALDQRNHGRSPRSEVFDYETMSADLYEFIEEHNLEKPILIGHSMGGKTVMNYAVRYPDTFSKLVIVDIAPKFYNVYQEKILAGLNAIQLDTLSNRNEADTILSNYEPNIGVRQFLLKNLYRNEANQFDWRINLPVIERNIASVGSAVPILRTVSEPTLFMHGTLSNYIKDEDIPALRNIFVNAQVDTILGAGHWVQAEQPEGFLKSLLRFLDVESVHS
jgi:pimeloyl-ACP methyl ester carboxylesterase